MSESGWYPPGAENDPNAPYNQVDPDPVDISVCASITLSKSATISVDDYTAEEWEDYDTGDEGEVIHTGGVDYDFSDCNLLEVFKEQEYTIPELLERLKAYLTEDLAQCSPESCKGKELKRVLAACDGWTVDEEEVVEE